MQKSLSVVVHEIATIHERIRKFWSNAYGWAPKGNADLLNAARLDRLVSLAHCLNKFCRKHDPETADGMLLLAWATLGALTEGTMKFFLCVFAHDYVRDFGAVEATKRHPQPDGLMFENLKVFFRKKVWTENECEKWSKFVDLVQERRNAIHAFKHRELGTPAELRRAIRIYHQFLSDVHGSVPYPDLSDEY